MPNVCRAAFHVMLKPVGSACNLQCDYCYYREKEALFRSAPGGCMSDEVLAAFTQQYIESNPAAEVEFAWQGGEPTLLGADFYRNAINLQQQFSDGRRIRNTLQTNGTLLTDELCSCLAEHGFLVGLSIDGPEPLHNRHRRFASGEGSFDSALRGLDLLRKHGVEHNVLTCVARDSARKPLEVYRFLKGLGVRFIQFTPVVERLPDHRAHELGLALAPPPAVGLPPTAVTDWSVRSADYGRFLLAVFDEWAKKDVGSVYIMGFEWALAAVMGISHTLCHFSRRCGTTLVMERTGDVFSCDHFVYPEYRLGNILDSRLADLVESPRQVAFGRNKELRLPQRCQVCDVRYLCWGGCPKHRFVPTEDGGPPVSYLCEGLKAFYTAAEPTLKTIARRLSGAAGGAATGPC